MARYNFIETVTKDGRHKTICLSTYAGKTVRGIAICDPADEYSAEFGRRLAQARCDVKVAEKRATRAFDCIITAHLAAWNARRHLDMMAQYNKDSIESLDAANDALDSILKEANLDK